MLEVAYIAGFFDGEGCVTIYPWQQAYKDTIYRRHLLTVLISNVDREVLDELAAQYGGQVVPHNVKGREGRRQVWQWRLKGPHCRRFLLEIQPFVRVKRRQVHVGLRYTETLWECHGKSRNLKIPREWVTLRDQLYAELRWLNGRGVHHSQAEPPPTSSPQLPCCDPAPAELP